MNARRNAMRILFATVVALCVAHAALAQTVQRKDLISAGGQRMTDGTVTVSGNLGDVISGLSSTGTTVVGHGFWDGNAIHLLDVNGNPRAAEKFSLSRPQPNPAMGSTAFQLGIPSAANGSLAVFDLQGRTVRHLIEGDMPAGVYRVTWDLRTDGGQRVAPGVYLYRLSMPSFAAQGRIAVVH